jgi:hypothetical protein
MTGCAAARELSERWRKFCGGGESAGVPLAAEDTEGHGVGAEENWHFRTLPVGRGRIRVRRGVEGFQGRARPADVL